MDLGRWKHLLLRVVLLAAASVGPLAFPAAQQGIAPLGDLARTLILPAAALLAAAWFLLGRRGGDAGLATARLLGRGALAGVLATLALEAVRYPGFRLGFMPGNMPELMGALLMNRLALGPSMVSTLAGFAYHFWNGASFGMIFALLPIGHSARWAVPYGLAIGIGFLISPVVQGLGVGIFGLEYGWPFAATVLTAHVAFGAVLGRVLGAGVSLDAWPFRGRALREPGAPQSASQPRGRPGARHRSSGSGILQGLVQAEHDRDPARRFRS